MKATVFVPPNGEQQEITITKIRAEDREFFEKHGVKISMEELGGQNVVYADTGKVTDGEPDELIEISHGRSCEDTLYALRAACERRFVEEIREQLRRAGIQEELIDGQAKQLWHDRQRAGQLGGGA